MKTLQENVSWETARAAITAGKFARQAIWNTNKPTAAPDFQGFTALGVDKATGKFHVITSDGRPIHEWTPSVWELESSEWQVCELDGPSDPAPASAAPLTAVMPDSIIPPPVNVARRPRRKVS